MAVGTTTVVKQGVIGNMKYAVVDVVGATSYTTTGDALDLNAICGFTNIYMVDVTVNKTTAPAVNIPLVSYDVVAKKLQSFATAAAAAGFTETTNATNLSALTIRCFVIGS